ncbi:MAG: hypothetical protein NC081_05425 [Roseburia sp.]|nr:hypothetical protein [Lachnospiraceae bacterium]MCM1568873.1 hypothetical protein [Roseburia sp.]
MKEEILIELFGEIDDKYIMEAAPKRNAKPKLIGTYVVVAALLFVVIGIYAAARSTPVDYPSSYSLSPGPGASQSFFYYNGYMYSEKRLIEDIPEGTTLLGEINNIGNDFDKYTGEDFEGNDDGFIYIDPNDDGIMYVWPKYWDSSIVGKARYVVFTRDT